MWFEDLVGFEETTGDEVRRQLRIEGEFLTSTANGRRLRWGRLETPSLDELRLRAGEPATTPSTLREIVGDAGALHRDPSNAGALFQVASQFNLLEMASTDATPERGVGIYQHDPTQGPACAVACGAGTIYRNWYAPVAGDEGLQIGQTAARQIDCLADLGRSLDNTDGRLWVMKNGYGLATAAGLAEIAERLDDPNERDRLRGLIRIGLQLDTEVTTSAGGHIVSQAYCSALPVGYSSHDSSTWEPFARLVLEATYEATFLAAAENTVAAGNNTVFLTLVGGGVFGNRVEWIIDAIRRAFTCHPNQGLDVAIVSYQSSSSAVAGLINSLS